MIALGEGVNLLLFSYTNNNLKSGADHYTISRRSTSNLCFCSILLPLLLLLFKNNDAILFFCYGSSALPFSNFSSPNITFLTLFWY